MAKRDNVMRGKRLAYNAALQEKYRRELERLVKQMTVETKAVVTKFMNGDIADDYFAQQKEAAAMDASISSQARILMNKLKDRFDQLFGKKAKPIAEKMVEGTIKTSQSSLHASLKQLSGGLSLNTSILYEGMKQVSNALIEQNVNLITSIPEQYLKNVTGSVMRSITFGEGINELIPAIEKHGGVTKRRARNIALDQTRKAYNSLNKQRMQAIGVKRFEWVHSGGGAQPRQSHIAMSGNIYSFDNLPVINQEQVARGYESPVRGIPGQAINCRCTMVPVIEFDDSD